MSYTVRIRGDKISRDEEIGDVRAFCRVFRDLLNNTKSNIKDEGEITEITILKNP